MPTQPRRTSRSNSRTLGSAAAFAGVIGLPDPGRGPTFGDGGLYAFARVFSERFDQKSADNRPEWRSFSRAERAARPC